MSWSSTDNIVKWYQVWSEGYRATGEHGTAMCHTVSGPVDHMYGQHGTPSFIAADSFDDACLKLQAQGKLTLDTDDTQPDGYRRNSKGNFSIWACGLYDNEKDAREAFG